MYSCTDTQQTCIHAQHTHYYINVWTPNKQYPKLWVESTVYILPCIPPDQWFAQGS